MKGILIRIEQTKTPSPLYLLRGCLMGFKPQSNFFNTFIKSLLGPDPRGLLKVVYFCCGINSLWIKSIKESNENMVEREELSFGRILALVAKQRKCSPKGTLQNK